MLEGVRDTSYADPANTRPRLLTPAGRVSIADAVETAISSLDAARFGYLCVLEAVCTVASTAAGTWTLRDAVGGATLLILQQAVVASVLGTRYVWTFPVPWKTAAVNNAFSIQQNAAATGTWIWTVNGFRSAV